MPTAPWVGWVAIADEEDGVRFFIAPIEFWNTRSRVPDHSLGYAPEGFRETQEHCIESLNEGDSLDEAEEKLVAMGFEML
jgi:hypothetical protein